MLQNLATNTFLPDRAFSGWFLSITSGLQGSRLAKEKGWQGAGGRRSQDNLKPHPQSMNHSKFSYLQRVSLDIGDRHHLCLPPLCFTCFSMIKKNTLAIFLFRYPGTKHVGATLGSSTLSTTLHKRKGKAWDREGRCLLGANVSPGQSSSSKFLSCPRSVV